MSSSGADVRGWLAAWLPGALLLCAGTLAHVSRYDLAGPSTEGRFREEVNIATVRHATGRFPAATYEVGHTFFARDPQATGFHDALVAATRQAGVQPWQFWRTVPVAALPIGDVRPVRVIDDRGRAFSLSIAYGALGGVAPYLMFWLGLLAALPVAAWLVFELRRAGHGLAGGLFLILLGASPYVAETLALAYSPAGFHLVGLLALGAFAVHAALHPRPTVRSLALRAATAGTVLAGCLACRRGTVLLAGGFVLAVLLGARRLADATTARRGLAAVLLAGLVAAPGVALLRTLSAIEDPQAQTARPLRRHNPWLNLWEGLGDFDREKGYTWSDRRAMQYVVDRMGPLQALGARSEAAFRRKVLRDIREDPAWYAAILLRRLGATLSLHKLRPWNEDRSFAPATSENEGAIDSYYGLVATVDHLGVGPWRVELPVFLLWGPTAGALLAALVRRRWPAAGWVVACLAVAALLTPVAISTASGIETQTIAIAYHLATAFVVQAGFRRRLAAQHHQGEERHPEQEGTRHQQEHHPEHR